MKQHFPGKRALLHDEGYSGPLKSSRYFEGWYTRQVTADKSRTLAVIVGISLASEPHAFIQLLSGPEGKVLKVKYPLEELIARRDRFEVQLGGNFFSPDRMVLSIHNGGEVVEGELEFSERVPFPSTPVSPGVMGPFSWVPFMECIHGIISMDHCVNGQIKWNDDIVDFSSGRGYIEKDRGRSMPTEWIWVHTNQFENPGNSLLLSVARIPFLGGSFAGHLGFLRFDSQLHRFGTYTGSRVFGSSSGSKLDIRVESRHRVLELWLEWEGDGGTLDAPVDGSMSREIVESPLSTVKAILRERGSLIWEGKACPAAVEVVGPPGKLLSQAGRA